MNPHVFNIWTWRGRVGRTQYLVTGAVLLALKHNLDRLLAAVFGYEWGFFNYFIFDNSRGISALTSNDTSFYTVLLLVALPFIWSGVTLTLRRLRDADLPLWLVVLFFVPLINLLFFGLLCAVPSSSSSEDEPSRLSGRVGRWIPKSEFGSAAFGVVVTALLTGIEIVFTTNGLGNYGWGLFVGIPFFLGLSSTLIYSFHEPRSLGRCLLVAVISTGILGCVLFAFAIEGAICLAMALPLALVLAVFGAIIGYVLQSRPSFSTSTLQTVSLGFLLLPGLILAEHTLGPTPPVYEVKTSVVIKSDLQTVWKHVVTFSELPPPTEALFKTGIAYPIRAEMRGRGVGAVRYCKFSTGDFVEPITVWDEPRLLAFDVVGQPAAMEEISLYNSLRPPHLENYFVARKGQFELKSLPDGTTLLEGTTWYQNRFWPAAYWHLWSDEIIDVIHNRVLLHIKSLAESESK